MTADKKRVQVPRASNAGPALFAIDGENAAANVKYRISVTTRHFCIMVGHKINAVASISLPRAEPNGEMFATGTENPRACLLVVDWHTVEDHMVHCRASDDFQERCRLVGLCFDGAPVVTHFATAVVGFSCPPLPFCVRAVASPAPAPPGAAPTETLPPCALASRAPRAHPRSAPPARGPMRRARARRSSVIPVTVCARGDWGRWCG